MKTTLLKPTLLCAALGFACFQSALSAAEKLDRGLVAVRTVDRQVFLSWRLLISDPPDVTFSVLFSETQDGPFKKMTKQPVQECNYLAKLPARKEGYFQILPHPASTDRPELKGNPVPVISDGQDFIRIKLQGNYRAQKVGLGDFDGDGRMDYLIKQPNFNTDPYQQPGYWKKSLDTYKLEAYNHDGRFMWRYDMGWAIEEGIWYSPIVVYDVDGDGKAEVYCKAGEGDPRKPAGHVESGPEFLVKLDGLTGEVTQKVPWPSREGFTSYNYYSRNLLGVAYLDGLRPHLIVERGTYKLIKLQAYDSALQPKWYWDTTGEYGAYRGQGMHGMHAADVDEDGRDELVIGSAVIDDNGTPLWTTRKGHPDSCYVADIDPARPGLEIFYGIEPGRKSNTVCVVEAKTGQQIWGSPEITVHVHGQGMVGDIIPEYPGMECYAGEAKGGSNYWLYSAQGQRLSDKSLGELAPKAVYWLGGSNKVYIVRNQIYQWPRKEIGRVEGNIAAIADCLGDWREEIITALDGEIRIYTTTAPTQTRRPCLLQDRLYRTDVAVQTMGYFHPPQLGGTLIQ